VETGNVVFFAPASVARLYPRPGIAFRPASGLPDATLVLAWPPGRALAGRRRRCPRRLHGRGRRAVASRTHHAERGHLTASPPARRRAMFARVITAQAGAEGFDGTIGLAEQQLPGARQMPGFQGYYLLTDAETGKIVIISLWETREQMDAVTAGGGPSGVREQHNPAMAGLTALHLDTYEVALHS
jgi:heme-degrading monooxygenase HmoA